MAKFVFGHTFRFASYRIDPEKGKPDYVPYFCWGELFKCLPLLIGNLYIFKGDHRMSWEK